MSDNFDFREVTDDENVDIKDTKDTTDTVVDDEKPQYEDVCFVCRRPESKAGKMFHHDHVSGRFVKFLP